MSTHDKLNRAFYGAPNPPAPTNWNTELAHASLMGIWHFDDPRLLGLTNDEVNSANSQHSTMRTLTGSANRKGKLVYDPVLGRNVLRMGAASPLTTLYTYSGTTFNPVNGFSFLMVMARNAPWPAGLLQEHIFGAASVTSAEASLLRTSGTSRTLKGNNNQVDYRDTPQIGQWFTMWGDCAPAGDMHFDFAGRSFDKTGSAAASTTSLSVTLGQTSNPQGPYFDVDTIIAWNDNILTDPAQAAYVAKVRAFLTMRGVPQG